MRIALLAAATAAAFVTTGADDAAADGHTAAERLCFDKGALRYVECEPDPLEAFPTVPIAPVETVFSFTGFRVGVHAGYVFGDADTATRTTLGALVGTNGVDLDGAAFGLSAGYDYDFGGVVLGVEGDVELNTLGGDSAATVAVGEIDGSYLASIRARLGAVVGRQTLVYLTGGYEMQEIDIRLAGTLVEASETIDGYTIGAGAEHMINSDVSLRLEYRYTDYDGASVAFPGQNRVVDFDPETHAIRLGLGYRF